ncbi:sugar ABC transporter ATP-binding protein [Geodermatophilus sabuli]|uniref:Monosaccharide ABC transporter ATP-binding protein, CUT2 family n=1 Tax=Geodermatophilus sabuli TaxID=1564158 RepID=A0A285EIF3_9ACTN|nr:sugar ABC transporter ATP-binding protein [Geodermatophilus sabuli]MBB3086542.1 ribose transport system ATP-binding protein [Geodermatophilus sabuli]SNX97806.1 monosaccharide ABC transporter ATP-binding protein, CUT2 family [Geodermatophilus sabuli]
MTTPLLEMHGIVKSFPGVRALDGVDLDVRAGEVHCLLGQNGAGKSTLIKVLAGAHQPDAGRITWRGEPVSLSTPQAAMSLGIATIYQELDLVAGLTVADNIFLGREFSRLGLTRPAEGNRAATALLTRLGHPEIRPTAEVGSLPAAAQQMVSIARALSQDAKLIIMDEPSAVLDNEEVERLFAVMRDLTADDVAVVYISHRLEEIRQVGDRITVLKDGRTVATGLPARETPTREVITLMTGRDIEYVFPERRARPAQDEAPLLEVEGLGLRGSFADVTFTVRAGEVVGLAGLVGSGRSEILETVYGARRAGAGTVRVAGRRLRPGDVAAAVAAGVGLAPEERKSQALLLGESVYRNISISSLARFARGGFLSGGSEKAAAREQVAALDVRPADVDREVRTLSGGNQQKVVLARWLLRDCRVLLLDEPTRGVDVGARSEIYALIRDLADRGVAVVVVSSEIPEVLGLADRVLVIGDGRVLAAEPAGALDEHRVLDLVMEDAAAHGGAAHAPYEGDVA